MGMEGRAGSEGTIKLLAVTFVVGTVLGLAGMAVWAAVDDDGGGGGGDTPAETSRLGLADGLKSQGNEPSASSEHSGHTQPTQSDQPSEAAESPPATAATDTRAQRCMDAARALEAPLRAARPALEQWDVHVGAMNKLVVGEITLQQATSFWNRTRLGAQRNVERFRTAWEDVERTGVDCPAPDLMGPAPAPVRACSRLVAAELGVLRTARTSITTWDKHVHHMDMLRMGTLSPEDATRMWLTMWKRGVQELRGYRTAARAPGMDATCSGAAG
jgi:hypothetical protein